MRILLAEDSVVARKLPQGTLTASGYEVVLAEDGRRPGGPFRGRTLRAPPSSTG
jgi:CheY-like chemotaxis protein